jgi:predicted DNA-binding protein
MPETEKIVSIRLTTDQVKRMEERAQRNERTLSAEIRVAVKAYLEQPEHGRRGEVQRVRVE